MIKPNPRQLANIKDWLEGSLDGRRLVYDAFERYIPREPVLVVISHDEIRPLVEVYAESTVVAKVVNKIYCDTTAGRIMAEELLERRLPPMFRSLYFPNRIVAAEIVDRITPEEEIQRIEYASMVRAVDGLRRDVPTNGPTRCHRSSPDRA